ALEHSAVTRAVGAEQQTSVGSRRALQAAEKGDGVMRLEVADRRARKERERAPDRPARRRHGERPREVADDDLDIDVWMLAAQHRGRVLERYLRDIDAYVRGRMIERTQQALGLDPDAAARLDHARRDTDVAGDPGQVLVEQAELDAGQVVVVE